MVGGGVMSLGLGLNWFFVLEMLVEIGDGVGGLVVTWVGLGMFWVVVKVCIGWVVMCGGGEVVWLVLEIVVCGVFEGVLDWLCLG